MFPILTGRSAVAERRPEGSETPGEGLPGAAAQPTQERLRREAGQGEAERPPSSSRRSVHELTSLLLSLTQMVSKLPTMKSICNLHIDKLEFFRLVHPETAYSFPPLYREVFGSEMSLPDSTDS